MTRNESRQADMASCLTGERLYGDDFSQEEIDRWFADEAEAYVDLTGDGVNEFGYMQWAIRYGYRHLPQRRWRHVLGFGSGRGGELLPLRAVLCSIVESSSKYLADQRLDPHPEYIPAHSTGNIPIPDAAIDLIVCFGVLHHIPNVTHIVREFARVSEPGAWAVIREPITSMGDWTRARSGLTPHERGIPIKLLEEILDDSGFEIRHRALVGFRPITMLWKYWKAPYNDRTLTVIDHWLCELLRWNLRYHAVSKLHKFRPTAAIYVVRRR